MSQDEEDSVWGSDLVFGDEGGAAQPAEAEKKPPPRPYTKPIRSFGSRFQQKREKKEVGGHYPSSVGIQAWQH